MENHQNHNHSFPQYCFISPLMQFELLEKVVALSPFLLFLWIFHRRFPALETAFQEQFGMAIFIIAMDMIGLAIFYLPFVLIWRKISPAKRKQAIEDTCRPFLEHFEECADPLIDLPPYIACLCTGIPLDSERLIAAQLLKFQLQGLVRIDRNFYHVRARGHQVMANLPTESERYLLGMLSRSPLTHEISAEWERLAHKEAVHSPYLAPKPCIHAKLAALLPFLAIPLGKVFCKICKPTYTLTAQGKQINHNLCLLHHILDLFPQLNHTQKMALTLWDDFFVYAILLEENPKIISRITTMRNFEILTPLYCEEKRKQQ